MSALPAEVELDGRVALWVWLGEASVTGPPQPGLIPAGVMLDHGDHKMLVPWAGDYPRVFTLDSLLPLTVVGSIDCSTCGASGQITDGAWVPSEKGGARG